MRIGVFGGTFNPIHNSHIYIAEEFAAKLELDRMVIVPSYTPPHKSSKDLAGAEDRLAMCRLATAHLPLFYVTEYEIRQEGKSYTYKTLRHILEKYPGSELFLIMGGDMFLTVQDWRLAPEIFRMATLCAAQRETGEFTLLDVHKDVLEMHGARCLLIDMEARPMSSTLVRGMIERGEGASHLLHPDVWAYIRQHKLYVKEKN